LGLVIEALFSLVSERGASLILHSDKGPECLGGANIAACVFLVSPALRKWKSPLGLFGPAGL